MKVAQAFEENQIFTDLHLRPGDERMAVNVFMPLMFMNFEEYEPEDLKQIGMVYEYYDKAGSRGINGYPMFMSMRFLHKNDVKRMLEIAEKLHNAKKKVMEEVNGTEGEVGAAPAGDSQASEGSGGTERSAP